MGPLSREIQTSGLDQTFRLLTLNYESFNWTTGATKPGMEARFGAFLPDAALFDMQVRIASAPTGLKDVHQCRKRHMVTNSNQKWMQEF